MKQISSHPADLPSPEEGLVLEVDVEVEVEVEVEVKVEVEVRDEEMEMAEEKVVVEDLEDL